MSDDWVLWKYRAEKAEGQAAQLKVRCGHQRRQLRNLQRAHDILWKVLNLPRRCQGEDK